MTRTVSSGTLNPSIPYHTIPDPLAGLREPFRGREGEGEELGKGTGEGWEGREEEERRQGRVREWMEKGRGKGDRGDGRDRTGHGMG